MLIVFQFIMNAVHCTLKILYSHRDNIDLGGHLASVHTQQAQNFLKTFVKRYANNIPWTWIGAHDGTKVADFPVKYQFNQCQIIVKLKVLLKKKCCN